MRVIVIFLMATLLFVSNGLTVAAAEEQPQVAESGKPIPYKTEKNNFGGLVLRTAIVFVFVIALVVAGLYLVGRYFPGLNVNLRPIQGAQAQRLRVIEIKRLTPKTTLFVVEYDKKTLLLGQSGDSLVLLDSNTSGLQGGNASQTDRV